MKQTRFRYQLIITCVQIAVVRGLLVGTSVLVSSSAVSSDVSAIIEQTQTALEQWVETRRVISKEKRDFMLAREMLVERIDLMSREIESLREKVAEAEGSIAEADKKRVELIEENEKLRKAAESIGSVLVSLEESTKKLLHRLPEPIRERIKPLTQRLPKDKNECKLSLSERFQNVVGILNEVNKANREITVTSEVRTLADGSGAEVTALYLGIGQAYYTGGNGSIAGVGTATEEGWVWKTADDAAHQIADAIAILKNEQVARFIHLPVEVQ